MIRTVVLVLVVAVNGFAAGTAGLAGRIVDTQGGALAQAQVKALRADGIAAASSVTGTSAEYRLERLVPGDYVLTVQRDQFRSATLNIRLTSAVTTHQDVTLEVAGVNQSVVVTAAGAAQTPDEVSKPVNIVSNDEITNRNDRMPGIPTITAIRILSPRRWCFVMRCLPSSIGKQTTSSSTPNVST